MPRRDCGRCQVLAGGESQITAVAGQIWRTGLLLRWGATMHSRRNSSVGGDNLVINNYINLINNIYIMQIKSIISIIHSHLEIEADSPVLARRDLVGGCLIGLNATALRAIARIRRTVVAKVGSLARSMPRL
jgi:hypothetical protein